MRLFLALTPPGELRKRLGELADTAHSRCGGRRMPDATLHVTLAFLGEVEPARASELGEWVRSLTLAPGEWHLDRWGSFQRPGIVWVGASRPDPALESLHRYLWETLEPLGLGPRPGRFTAHVTLLRRAACLKLESLPAIDHVWSYNQLELIHSITDRQGARYQTLAVSQL